MQMASDDDPGPAYDRHDDDDDDDHDDDHHDDNDHDGMIMMIMIMMIMIMMTMIMTMMIMMMMIMMMMGWRCATAAGADRHRRRPRAGLRRRLPDQQGAAQDYNMIIIHCNLMNSL